MSWMFLPLWGVRVLIAGTLVLMAFLVLRARRERKTVPLRRQTVALVMRLLVIAALLWIALNPTLLRPRKIQGKPTLMVLVDTSRSMATRDVDDKTRLAAALETLNDKSVRSSLERDFILDVRCSDRDVRAVNPSALSGEAANGRVSDIGSAVSSAVGDLVKRQVQAGVLLVSDGRTTTGGAVESARLALARSVPLWVWCLGGEVPRRDLWMSTPCSEALTFAGAEVELSATLHQIGYEHRSFAVEFRDGNRVVERIEVTPGPSGEAPVQVKVKAPKQGEQRYVFSVAEDPDEAEKQNNECSVFLRVVGKKVRVLLAEGQPHWDTKFLVQCLKRNPRVDVTAIYRLGKERQFAVISAGRKQQRTSSELFPRTAREFNQYDVIILGRGCETFFDDQTEEHLTDFVARRGGGLVFSRGKPYGGRFQPLAKLEPVIWGAGSPGQGVRMRPTETDNMVFELTSSDDLEALVNRLPVFDRVMHTVGVKPLAVTLLTGEQTDSVIMAYHLYGQGRVVTLNASGLWRWAFREKGKTQDEFVYDRFWIGMLRWLLSGSDFLAGHDVALRSGRRLYTDEQPMQMLIRTRGLDQEAYRPRLTIRPVEAENPAPPEDASPLRQKTSVEVEPQQKTGGTYVAEAGPFPPGTYEVCLTNNLGRPGELSQIVEVVSASIENRVLSADPDLCRRMADIAEGRLVSAEDVRNMGEIVRQWRLKRELAQEKQSMWDRWWLLTIVLVMLGVEWFTRRREGLL